MSRESVLARTMVELADNLVDDFDIVDVLTLLADRCVEVLDAAAAGIMLGGPDGQLQLMTSSNEAMRVVELFELQSAEGPCWDCFHSGRPVVNQDLTTAHERWPNFAPVAVAAGFLGSDAIPMRLRGTVIGALNLFRTERGSLSDDDVTVAQALADVATIAILQNRTSVVAARGQRPTHRGVDEPDRDRAGEGHHRRTPPDPHRRRLRRAAPSRPQPQPAPGRAGQGHRRRRRSTRRPSTACRHSRQY